MRTRRDFIRTLLGLAGGALMVGVAAAKDTAPKEVDVKINIKHGDAHIIEVIRRDFKENGVTRQLMKEL